MGNLPYISSEQARGVHGLIILTNLIYEYTASYTYTRTEEGDELTIQHGLIIAERSKANKRVQCQPTYVYI